jgi:hypothetical protein
LDEEKSKHAGLAHHNRTVLWWLVNGAAAIAVHMQKKECNKYNTIGLLII